MAKRAMSVVATAGPRLVVVIALACLASCGQKGPLIAAKGAASGPTSAPALDVPVPAVITSPAPP